MNNIDLLKRLPKVKGKLLKDAPLVNYNRFRTGGNAEVLFIPEDENDLQNFLKKIPKDISITTIGLGSNILIRDGGIDGVVIILSSEYFRKVDVIDENTIEAKGFVSNLMVSKAALENSIKGFEYLSCIPGSIGGSIIMNAGCYGSEIKDGLVSIKTIDKQGEFHTFENDQCGFEYRNSSIPREHIIISSIFKGEKSSKKDIEATMKDFKKKKSDTQPITIKTAGSTFKNPNGDKAAWKLIEESGSDKLTKGDAQMSKLHCNFMENISGATSTDLEELGEAIRKKVFDYSGIMLSWEIKILGKRKAFNS